MDKVKIDIFIESRYKINRKRVKQTLLSVLKQNEITSPVEISVAVVGDRKIKELAKKYMGDDKIHNVLSFSQTDLPAGRHAVEAMKFQSDLLRLGDIVISYPEVIREASKEEVLVDDKVDELVGHGLEHLLGIHHEKN